MVRLYSPPVARPYSPHVARLYPPHVARLYPPPVARLCPPPVARPYPPHVARPYPPPVARLYPPPVSRPHLKRFRSSEHYGLCNGQLDEFTTFFKCHVSMHGCRHIRPWLIKFSNVILNCVMLSHLIIFMEVSPTQEEQTLR